MSDLDLIFKAKAEQAEQEEREKASRKGSGFQPNYETIKWTGLETGKMKVIRAIGESPDFHLTDGSTTAHPYDARVVRIAKVINDKGKRMRVILPLKDRDENHLLWRIIDRVNEIEWMKDVNGKSTKVFVNKEAHPDIFNIVNFNNLPESAPQRKFGLDGKGWIGKEYFVMNVIDRGMMEWHKKNKHTVLLSKNVNIRKGEGDKVTEFVEEGVPAFGFTYALMTGIIKYYGFWEKYDIGIERTGIQTTPVRVINASKLIEQVPADLQKLVSGSPLTDEERSWERYDLDKLFGTTTYTKIWNNLKLTIAKIDSELGTHYLDELKASADKEAEDRKAKNQADPPGPDTTEEEAVVETPIAEEAIVREKPIATGDPSELPYWNKLSDKEKDYITSFSMMTPAEEKTAEADSLSKEKKTGKKAPWKGKIYKVNFKPVSGRWGECPDCGARSPEFFTSCHICGASFIF